MLIGAQTTSEDVTANEAEDSAPEFSPPAPEEAVPETSETQRTESLSFLQQNITSEGAEQPTEASATMGAFEQGPEVADVPATVVVPGVLVAAEGFSFMQTSELAGPESHAPAVQQQAAGQSAEDAFVQTGASENGPGVGMTNGPGSEQQPENAAAPSFAQLEAQTVSAIQVCLRMEFKDPLTAFWPATRIFQLG